MRMIRNKKGLSAVITTLIIILLVLVAIGIVWAVVSNLVRNIGDQTTSGANCIGVEVNIKSATCTSGTACTVVVERIGGGGDANGAKVTISGATSGSRTQTLTGGLQVLDVKTLNGFSGTTLSSGEAIVKAAAVLADGTICGSDEDKVTVP